MVTKRQNELCSDVWELFLSEFHRCTDPLLCAQFSLTELGDLGGGLLLLDLGARLRLEVLQDGVRHRDIGGPYVMWLIAPRF